MMACPPLIFCSTVALPTKLWETQCCLGATRTIYLEIFHAFVIAVLPAAIRVAHGGKFPSCLSFPSPSAATLTSYQEILGDRGQSIATAVSEKKGTPKATRGFSRRHDEDYRCYPCSCWRCRGLQPLPEDALHEGEFSPSRQPSRMGTARRWIRSWDRHLGGLHTGLSAREEIQTQVRERMPCRDGRAGMVGP
jgi:hypothetical protein